MADPNVFKSVAGMFGLKPNIAVQVKNEIRRKYKVRPIVCRLVLEPTAITLFFFTTSESEVKNE